MSLTLQYILIGIIFLVAVLSVIRKFLPSKKKKTGCGKGCGCDYTNSDDNKK